MPEPLTFLDGRVTLHVGDYREVLRALPGDSVDCVVTSPLYWGLRDYGVDGQIGLEPTLGEHIAVIVDVMEEVRRVLKPEGTVWFNYGDCYATTPNGRSAADSKLANSDDRTFRDKPFSTVGPILAGSDADRVRSPNSKENYRPGHGGRIVAGGYLKPGDLCMVPNRIAIALQDAGWWIKAEIIWGKPNGMPDSSASTRPASAHEKFFLLAKSNKVDLWRARDTGEISTCPDLDETCVMVTTGQPGKRWIRMPYYYDAGAVRQGRAGDEDSNGYPGSNGDGVRKRDSVGNHRVGKPDKQRGHSRRHAGFNARWDRMDRAEQQANGRHLRNYEPAPLSVWHVATRGFSGAHFATMPVELAERCIRAGCPKGGVVFDPFGGAGTTALAALAHGRRAEMIELNPDYAAITQARIEEAWKVRPRQLPPPREIADGDLFAGHDRAATR